MSRLISRFVRLLKFGAVAGAAVGVGRLVLNRRRQSATSEASWPTIAETAAQNGQPVEGTTSTHDSADSATSTDATDNAETADTAETTETADSDDSTADTDDDKA